MTDRRRVIPLPLGLLASAAFLSMAGARVIDPLLPVVAGDFHESIPAVAVLITAFTLPYGLNQLFLGPIGDRYGKLRVLLGALIGYSLATGACAFATDLPMLTLLRACAGAASAGMIPVGLAYIGDAVPYAGRQLAISRFLTGAVLAQIMAGPIGGVFGEYLGWRGLFLVLAALAALVAAVLALRIGRLPDRTNRSARFNLAGFRTLAGARLSRRLLVGALVDGALLGGTFPFVASFLREHHGLPYAGIGLIIACFGLGAWGYTRCAARIIARLGEPGMVLVGGALMALGLALGMLSPAWQVFPAVELMLGMGYMMLHGVLQARATEMLPDSRATAVAAFVSLLFLGQALGALAMGQAIASIGFRAGFLIVSALVMALGLWLRPLVRQRASAG
jgi:predicted MFS family arabinose efflux permease